MVSKSILLWLFVLALGKDSFSQTNETDTLRVRGSLFLELLGNSLSWSANIDYFVYRDPGFGLATRIGGGYTPGQWLSFRWNFVLGINAVFGPKPHYFEMGISNLTVQEIHEVNSKNYLGFLIGYRYQPKRKGILFRASFTPYYTKGETLGKTNLPIAPYGGVSIGWSY